MHIEPIRDAPGLAPQDGTAEAGRGTRTGAAPVRQDTAAFSPTAQALAQSAFSEDPRRYISDEKGPPYLRMGPLGPIWVKKS